VAYQPEWERLAEALDRVTAATGLQRREAQQDICRAIADRKITVRPRQAEPITRTMLDHSHNTKFAVELREFARQILDETIELSWRFDPDSLDWNESRSEVRFQPGYAGYPGPPRFWYVWIELFSSEVTAVLCDRKTDSDQTFVPRSAAYGGAKARGIEQAYNQLWPEGIPVGLSAKERNKAILERIEASGGSIPNSRTIQRTLKGLISK
jgi:hypothetical protein